MVDLDESTHLRSLSSDVSWTFCRLQQEKKSA